MIHPLELTMKAEERIASEFLTKHFGKMPTYEPLGQSTPPDFSIGGTAFEVRRLNQRFFHKDGTNEGLEQVDIPLNIALRKELSRIPFSAQGGTVLWGSRFRRPLTNMTNVVNQLAQAARQYYSGASREPKEIVIGGVTLDLFPASEPLGQAMILGYRGDDDSWGMFSDIYPISIRLALEDKINKTRGIADKFDRWILVLVDEILPTMMGPSDLGPLHMNLGNFRSIVIINPDASLALEYPNGSLKLQEQIRQRAYEFYEKHSRQHGHDLDDWLKAEAELSS
jgi:hypothetical protein